MNYDSSLMYTCSLIEFMGRKACRRRGEIVDALGHKMVRRIYRNAEVLHSDSIDRVADEYLAMAHIEQGTFDNVAACRYEVPDYWAIGEVFERLIEDVDEGDVLQTLFEVYASWMCDAISNFNSDLFYQPRDYLRECYRAGEVIDA